MAIIQFQFKTKILKKSVFSKDYVKKLAEPQIQSARANCLIDSVENLPKNCNQFPEMGCATD